MTFKYLIFFIISIHIMSCSKGQTIEKFENKLNGINNWKFKIVQNKTDTTNLVDWFPNSEISIEFKFKADSTCLSPTFQFYPIELEKYINKKLLKHLKIRAMRFPSTPKTYRTEKYFVIGWNLVDYDTFICCKCAELEMEITERLGLKNITEPQKIDRLIKENE